MTLVTAFAAVAACGSDADDSAAPPAAGPHSVHAGGSSAPPRPLRAGERFLDLKMAEAYPPTPPEGGTDEYRCQMIDPGLTRTAFLTGTQFAPGNVAIAHHAIVYAVPPGGAAAVREQDAKTPGLGWRCFGGTGVAGAEVEEGDAAWVDTWAPGATETLLDQDAGHKMEPGSLLILQIHYNLLATDGKPAGSDRSAVRLRLTDGTPQTRARSLMPTRPRPASPRDAYFILSDPETTVRTAFRPGGRGRGFVGGLLPCPRSPLRPQARQDRNKQQRAPADISTGAQMPAR